MSTAIGRHCGDEIGDAGAPRVVDLKDLEPLEAGLVHDRVRVHALAGAAQVVVGQPLGPVDSADNDVPPHGHVALVAVAGDIGDLLRIAGGRDVNDAEAVVAALEGEPSPEGEVAVDAQRRRLKKGGRLEGFAERVKVLAVRVRRVRGTRPDREGQHVESKQENQQWARWRSHDRLSKRMG